MHDIGGFLDTSYFAETIETADRHRKTGAGIDSFTIGDTGADGGGFNAECTGLLGM
jgi:hypothetical protein